MRNHFKALEAMKEKDMLTGLLQNISNIDIDGLFMDFHYNIFMEAYDYTYEGELKDIPEWIITESTLVLEGKYVYEYLYQAASYNTNINKFLLESLLKAINLRIEPEYELCFADVTGISIHMDISDDDLEYLMQNSLAFQLACLELLLSLNTDISNSSFKYLKKEVTEQYKKIIKNNFDFEKVSSMILEMLTNGNIPTKYALYFAEEIYPLSNNDALKETIEKIKILGEYVKNE